ncbi:CRP-like cAMP-binding protein [Rhizomicrobium palustre]|uniref:CRP-like cAMP-binding protein n=1 Tax=Rhizomicrobium palustre TaxID=189966 RepID=A0A846MZA9_9PROT|nr:Crp/Fnr family transcriptional regulator [Rhizomicrobium palustre]NIK88342.1 CRP-like cAMP-binding protein [Rhizomicrobium palustre]
MSRNLLSILELPQNQRLLSSFYRVKIPSGSSLSKAHTVEPVVAILISGQIRAYLSVEGQELTIFRAVERGELVHLSADLILRARRSSELLLMPREAFLKLMATDPDFFWSAYPWLEARLAQALRIIVDIRFLDVRTRVIRFIIDLCTERGTKVLDGTSIPFDFKIEDVASIIGSSRQSASQVLNELIRERLLRRVSRTQLIVPDVDKLASQLTSIKIARHKPATGGSERGGRLTVGCGTTAHSPSSSHGLRREPRGKSARPQV